eukprot:scaffold3181_cov167-Amphora_coffeaeformis.AAC.10
MCRLSQRTTDKRTGSTRWRVDGTTALVLHGFYQIDLRVAAKTPAELSSLSSLRFGYGIFKGESSGILSLRCYQIYGGDCHQRIFLHLELTSVERPLMFSPAEQTHGLPYVSKHVKTWLLMASGVGLGLLSRRGRFPAEP